MGITLYELVTGHRPFEGDSEYSIMAAHLESTPVPPTQRDPALPAALSDIILTSIAKQPAQRFRSAVMFRAALDNVYRASAPPVDAKAPPRASRVMVAGNRGKRRGLNMALGSVVTLGVLVIAGIQVPKWKQSSAVSPPAQVQQAAQSTQTPAVPAAKPSTSQPPPAPTPRRLNLRAGPLLSAPKPVPPPPKHVPAIVEPAALVPVAETEDVAQAQSKPSASDEQPLPDPGRIAALRELRERLMLLGARVRAAKDLLENLRASQARSGFTLRGNHLRRAPPRNPNGPSRVCHRIRRCGRRQDETASGRTGTEKDREVRRPIICLASELSHCA